METAELTKIAASTATSILTKSVAKVVLLLMHFISNNHLMVKLGHYTFYNIRAEIASDLIKYNKITEADFPFRPPLFLCVA